MDKESEKHEPDPAPGWLCATVGIGFIVFLVATIFCVLKIGGG
jgi:hypothetical protein